MTTPLPASGSDGDLPDTLRGLMGPVGSIMLANCVLDPITQSPASRKRSPTRISIFTSRPVE